MALSTLDWTIVGAYFALSLIIGLWVSRQAGTDTKSFFHTCMHSDCKNVVVFPCCSFKHGTHNTCNNGKGGSWGLNIYRILPQRNFRFIGLQTLRTEFAWLLNSKHRKVLLIRPFFFPVIRPSSPSFSKTVTFCGIFTNVFFLL